MRKYFFLLFAFLFFIDNVIASGDSLLTELPDTFTIQNKNNHLEFIDRNLRQGNLELAKAVIEKSKTLATNAKDDNLIAMLNYYLADYYYYAQDYDKSLSAYIYVFSHFEAKHDTLMMAKTLNGIGIIYYLKSDNDNSFKYYFKEVEILEKVAKPDRKIEEEKLLVQINILNLYFNNGQYDDIINTGNDVIQLAQTLQDSMRLGIVFNAMGMAYKNAEKYEMAVKSYGDALTIFESRHDDFSKAFVVLNLGYIYQVQKEFDLALKNFRSALKVFEKENYKDGIFSAKEGIADTYFEMKEYEASKKILLSIVDSCKQYGFDGDLLNIYDHLANIEYLLKNYKSAYDYRKMHNALNDSVFSEESHKQYAELEIKYKTAQKETEIVGLKADKEIRDIELRKNRLLKWLGFSFSLILIALLFFVFQLLNQKRKANALLVEKGIQVEQQNKQLLVMNQEVSDINDKLKLSQSELTSANNAKNRFFSILAHDLKNPFHNILGGSFLLSSMYEKLSIDERKRYASDLYTTSEQVHRLLENLLEWTRTQTNGIQFCPRQVIVSQLVVNVISVLKKNADDKNITISSNVDADLSVDADKEMLETIIRNTMNNSIKFTPEGGKITVSSHRDDSGIVICVEDNGVGIAKENLEKLFQLDSNYKTKGTKGERGTGLGLVICKEFVDYHKGNIWVESVLGEGTKFFISLPYLQ
jgi:signal transduction histidine kinase